LKKIPASITEKLSKRKVDGTYRTLAIVENKIDFFSNDYLGMSKIETKTTQRHGSTGSRLISGNLAYTEQLEKELAAFFGKESALLYNSGYDANLGFFSCIPLKGDTIFYDEFVHASIRDGIQLSFAKSYSFKHNDIDDLKKKIAFAEGTVYVVVESIYSMDGDAAPIEKLIAITEEINGFLIVDEAHSAGIFGEKGQGLVSEKKLDDFIFAKLITFGKAFGSHGAIWLCDNITRNYLINFSRAFIYTTALPPITQERIREAVFTVSEMHTERQQLFKNITLFREIAKNKDGILINSTSPIQSLLIKGNSAAKNKAHHLLNNGFNVKAILSPTVAKEKERIRICLHSYNTENEIRNLLNCI